MACSLTLYVGNNNVVELQELTNSVTGTADTGATVTCTVKDMAGDNITGQSWPATMSHVSGGTYNATLEDEINISANTRYVVHIDAVGSSGEVGHWESNVIAEIRTS